MITTTARIARLVFDSCQLARNVEISLTMTAELARACPHHENKPAGDWASPVMTVPGHLTGGPAIDVRLAMSIKRNANEVHGIRADRLLPANVVTVQLVAPQAALQQPLGLGEFSSETAGA